jgi:hypothetical protein
MIVAAPTIEVRYKRSVLAELDDAIKKAEADKIEIECFILNDSDFYSIAKEIGGTATYDKMSNSFNLKYKEIPIRKKV